MLLRLIAFVLFVAAVGTLCGDAWASFTSGLSFHVRSLETWWMALSPSTLESMKTSWPNVAPVLTYPAPAVLGVLMMIVLLPTIFFRQRH